MKRITENSRVWRFLSVEQRVLAGDGQFLLDDSMNHINEDPTDYSYLVFPYAKLYEGFLKDIFLSAEIISQTEYVSDHFRIGKALSPSMVSRLGKSSAYRQISERYGKDLATELWHAWKEGRNMVFHYFPHNYKALSRDQATILIDRLVTAMDHAVERMREGERYGSSGGKNE
ncbi:MAG: hypothetical protein AAB508_06830 [Patescibacteria group bacterium]